MSNTTAQNVANVIPLGRRIGEIMEEKGGAFSIRAFAPRVGLSKDTLGRMIDGTRPIKPSELKMIAERLSLSIERIKRDDTLETTAEIEKLLTNKHDLQRALTLARKNHDVALGITEKCDATTQVARVFYALGNYDQAHELLLQAYQFAESVFDKYQENDRLYNVLSKLMITFTVRKEYSNLSNILHRVETVFASNPEKQAAICFSKAMIAEQLGNIEQVQSQLYKSLELYRLTGTENDIGRAEQNVGFFEFKQKNYLTAKQYLESSIDRLRDDKYYQCLAIKEYVKTLLKLEEHNQAIHWLEQTMNQVDVYPELKGKYQLLVSLAKNDPFFAESNFLIANVGKKVLRLTCKYLMQHYAKAGDSEAVMKYAIIADRYSLSDSDLIHEEDL